MSAISGLVDEASGGVLVGHYSEDENDDENDDPESLCYATTQQQDISTSSIEETVTATEVQKQIDKEDEFWKEYQMFFYTLIEEFPSVSSISQYDVLLCMSRGRDNGESLTNTTTNNNTSPSISDFVQRLAYYNENETGTTSISNITIPQQNQGSYRCEFICEMFLLNYIQIIQEQEHQQLHGKDDTAVQLKIDQLVEQTYDKLFEYIDPDYQRSGTFLLLVFDEHNAEENGKQRNDRIVELPISWSFEFIRQQLSKMENYHNISRIASAPVTTPTIEASTDESTPITPTATQQLQHHSLPTSTLTDESMKRRRRSSLLRRSLSSGDVFEDFKKRMSTYRDNTIPSDDDEDGADNESTSDSFVAAMRSVNSMKSTDYDVNNDSISSFNLDDVKLPAPLEEELQNSNTSQSSISSYRIVKKVASPFKGQRVALERSPSWSEGVASIQTNHSGNVIIHTANALDVIFMKKGHHNKQYFTSNNCKYQLIPTPHTGNMRILVMVQMDLAKYVKFLKQHDTNTILNGNDRVAKPSQSDQQIRRLLRDIVDVVKNNFKGRFLMEGDNCQSGSDFKVIDTSSDYFVLLTDEQAMSAIECIFQTEMIGLEPTESIESIKQNGLVDAFDKIDTKKQIPNGLMDAFDKMDTKQQIPNSFATRRGKNNDPAASNSKPPENALLDVENIEEMHKASIMALQKRKKRQSMNKKISKMTTSYHPPIIASHFGGRSQSVGEAPQSLPSTNTISRLKDRSQSVGETPQQSYHGIRSQSFRLSELIQPTRRGEKDPMNTSISNNRMYSSLPAVLSDAYEYENNNNITSEIDLEVFADTLLDPQVLSSNLSIPAAINEMDELHPNDIDYTSLQEYHRFMPERFDPQALDEHQYYQTQQMQIAQQAQLNIEQSPQSLLQSQQTIRRASSRRQSTLSTFSQTMIQDMLQRAHSTEGDNDFLNDMETFDKLYGNDK